MNEPAPPADAPTDATRRAGCLGVSWWTVAAVLLVCGLLWGLLLPAVSTPRSAVDRSMTQHDLKQIGLGLHNYHSSHARFPPPPGDADAPNPPTAWMTALLPYMDEVEAWKRYDPGARYDAPANAAAVALEVEAYLTHADDWRERRAESGFGLAHYAGNADVIGPDRPGTIQSLRDGTTATLLAGQIDGFPRPWADPENLRDASPGLGRGPRQFGTPFRSGETAQGMILMCDGSVIYIPSDIDPAAFAALGTPDGGEDVSHDAW